MANFVIYSLSVLICYLLTDQENVEPSKSQTSETLNIKSGRQTFIVKFADILSIQADGRYAKVVTEGKATLLSVSMRSVQKMLPSNFIRIHRSTIINASYVTGTRSLMNGDYVVTIKNGDRLKVSRTYRDALRDVIGKF